MEDLLMDLIVEYNYERKLEAIARDEKNETETRAHSRAAYALSNVLEKALIKEDMEIIRLTKTFEYFNKVDLINKRISVAQIYLLDVENFSQR